MVIHKCTLTSGEAKDGFRFRTDKRKRFPQTATNISDPFGTRAFFGSVCAGSGLQALVQERNTSIPNVASTQSADPHTTNKMAGAPPRHRRSHISPSTLIVTRARRLRGRPLSSAQHFGKSCTKAARCEWECVRNSCVVFVSELIKRAKGLLELLAQTAAGRSRGQPAAGARPRMRAPALG